MDNTTSYGLNPQPSGNKNKTLIVITVLVLLAALVGGYFYLQSQSAKTEETKVAVEEQPNPTSAPSPTEKPIDKSKVKIQVLNGTGTPGEAKKAVDALVKAGYDADNITTGNAEEFENTLASIAAKDGFTDVAEDIQKALDSTFEDVEIESKELAKDSDYDIVVTTGGELFKAPTNKPTVKPTTSTSTTSPTPTTGSTTTTTPTKSPTPTP